MESVRESAPASSSVPGANSVPPFLSKTYDMVDDPSTNDVVSWSSSNNSFVVWNVPEFARDLLPKYFKHSNFSSFVRQLNTYGFRKVDPDRWEFANEGFLRGQKHLLKSIVRRKPAHGAHGHTPQQPHVQSSSVGACVEVGKFGLEEEVERLKRDKNVLMQELVRLRQQQQNTEHQLQTVGQKVHVMEQRQQQMMSFLAKAVQSPGFLNHFVQQKSESTRCIGGNNKKRRLPKEDENASGSHVANGLNGQIVKYQPSMNEAAKAMLRQILKMNTSPRIDQYKNNSGSYLLDNVQACDVLNTGSTTNQLSGVTVSEVAPVSGQSCATVESGFPVGSTSTAATEMHSAPCNLNETRKLDKTQESNLPDPEQHLLKLSQMRGTGGGAVADSSADLLASETLNADYMDTLSDVLDGTMAVEAGDLSPDDDELMDKAPKLPGINDAFWEQFLAVSPESGDTDEIGSDSLGTGLPNELEFQPLQVNGWEKTQQLDSLTEQMGLLISENPRG